MSKRTAPLPAFIARTVEGARSIDKAFAADSLRAEGTLAYPSGHVKGLCRIGTATARGCGSGVRCQDAPRAASEQPSGLDRVCQELVAVPHRLEIPMHRLMPLGIAAGCLTLGLSLAPAAQAAPRGDRFTYTQTNVDVSFCGIGLGKVTYSSSVSGTDFLAKDGSGDVKTVAHGTATWTSDTATVIMHFAQRFTITNVSGDPDGIHVIEFTNVGSQQLRLEGGGVLEMIAGPVTWRDTFDGDEFISEEVFYKGLHPEIESNYTSFCTVMTEALGF
jgi:hypothetical protein